MNKTAIQQMMSDLNDTFPKLFNVHSAEGRVFMGIAAKYLAIEKEQIKDAYYNGTTDEIMTKEELLQEAEHFYNETYGGNK